MGAHPPSGGYLREGHSPLGEPSLPSPRIPANYSNPKHHSSPTKMTPIIEVRSPRAEAIKAIWGTKKW